MLKHRILLLLVAALVPPSVSLTPLPAFAGEKAGWSSERSEMPAPQRQEEGEESPSAGGEGEVETETEDHRLGAKKHTISPCRRSHSLRDDSDAHLPAGVASEPDRPPKA